MRVKFWGTRGSIPVAMNAHINQDKLRKVLAKAVAAKLDDVNDIEQFLDDLPFVERGAFGGNTSCVQIISQAQSENNDNLSGLSNGQVMLCDLGTGVREFNQHLIAQKQRPQIFHIFMSHLHWDHIMGFPFFTPAYQRGNSIRIYGCHDNMVETFRRQHQDPNFPVDFSQLAADIEFIQLQPDTDYQINGFKVRAKRQIHMGDSYGYRFEQAGHSVVYSTDSEHKLEDQRYLAGVVEFFAKADLVIFDAMYSLLDSVTHKRDWGHSNNLTGVELCQRADVKQICLFHHEPAHSDHQIMQSLQEARDYENLTRCEHPRLQVDAAFDGLLLDLSEPNSQRKIK